MTLLERLNPSVKLLVLSALSLSLLVVFDPWTPGTLYLLCLGAAGVGRQVRVRTLLVGQVPFALFGLGSFTVNAVTRGGAVIWSAGPLEVTDDGIAVGLALALRTLVVGVAVIAFLSSTDPARLLSSLRQQLRLPARASYALLVGYRVLDELPEQWLTIRRAHAARHPDPRTSRNGRLPLTPALAWRATMSLLVVALRRGERLAIVMETRGLGAGPRTIWRPTPVTRHDLVFAVISVGVLALVFALTALTGRLAGPTSLTG